MLRFRKLCSCPGYIPGKLAECLIHYSRILDKNVALSRFLTFPRDFYARFKIWPEDLAAEGLHFAPEGRMLWCKFCPFSMPLNTNPEQTLTMKLIRTKHLNFPRNCIREGGKTNDVSLVHFHPSTNFELGRLVTFLPARELSACPVHLALQGYYYDKKKHKVKCAYCMCAWEKDPCNQHNPGCTLADGRALNIRIGREEFFEFQDKPPPRRNTSKKVAIINSRGTRDIQRASSAYCWNMRDPEQRMMAMKFERQGCKNTVILTNAGIYFGRSADGNVQVVACAFCGLEDPCFENWECLTTTQEALNLMLGMHPTCTAKKDAWHHVGINLYFESHRAVTLMEPTFLDPGMSTPLAKTGICYDETTNLITCNYCKISFSKSDVEMYRRNAYSSDEIVFAFSQLHYITNCEFLQTPKKVTNIPFDHLNFLNFN